MNPTGKCRCLLCASAGREDPLASRFLGLDASPYPYRVHRCRPCDFRWLSPQPGPEDLQRLYTKDEYFDNLKTGFSYEEQTRTSNHCMRAHIRKLRKYCSGARILDIGTATGEFVEIALKYGLDAEGVEFSECAVEVAQKKGLPVFQGDVYHPGLKPGTYNAIHINHVLEHLHDPKQVLTRVKELLTPGGIVFVEVPYQFDSLLDRWHRLSGSWPGFGPFSLHHLSFFSPRSLSYMLERTGFEVLSLKTYQTCRRRGRPFTIKFALLSISLWFADMVARKGDVISVWARSKQ